jgi:uncharacterized tellurite resistance protein B-like protein
MSNRESLDESPQNPTVSLNAQEAFTGFLLAVIAADGTICDEEMLDFYAVTSNVQLMHGLEPKVFSRMVDRLMGILRKQGAPVLLQLCAAGLPPDLRLGCFAYCCDLVYSDGNACAFESAAIADIQQLLQIPAAFAEKAMRISKTKSLI